MGMACGLWLVHQRSQFFAGQLLVHLSYLRGEGIPAGPAFTDVARYLGIAFQGCTDGLDVSLCLLGRTPGHEGANLFL